MLHVLKLNKNMLELPCYRQIRWGGQGRAGEGRKIRYMNSTQIWGRSLLPKSQATLKFAGFAIWPFLYIIKKALEMCLLGAEIFLHNHTGLAEQ